MAELHTLKNGLRVYADPMPGLESAAVGVWARAGTIDETPAEHGIAHLLEHMAFKGTGRRSARVIAEEIESVGGHLNAATSHLRTGYYARVLRDDVERSFDLLSDILTDPLFAEDELVKEKEVVIQEIGEAADTPDDVVYEMLQRICYPDHPLGQPILGTLESVRAQTPASLRGFMDMHYVGEDMIVAASGAVEPDEVFKWAETYFGVIAQQSDKQPPAKAHYGGGAEHLARDIEQTHIALGFPGVSARDDTAFATRLFAEVLGGGMSSRLFQKVREERGLAYSVYAFSEGYMDVGAVCAYAGTDQENAGEAVRLIRQEMEAMARSVDQQEIDRARAMLKSNVLMGLENPAGRIEAAAAYLMTFDRVLTTDEIRAKLDAVTARDIQAAARRAIDGEMAIAIVGPADMQSIL